MKFFKLVSFWLLVKCLCPSSGAGTGSDEMASNPVTTTPATDTGKNTDGKPPNATGAESTTETSAEQKQSGTASQVGGETTNSATNGSSPNATDTKAGEANSAPNSTAKESGSNATDGDSCDLFENKQQVYFNASEIANVTCTCAKSHACPVIIMDPVAGGEIIFQNRTSNPDGTCTAIWTIKALTNNFTRRRVQVPLTCSANGNTEKLLLTFEKKGNGQLCNEDVDCWSSDQVCNEKKLCSCYDGRPSYVYMKEKCFPDAGYEQHCQFDEQCITRDANTLCETNICKCREKYWAYNNTDNLCVTTTDAAAVWVPNQVTIFTTAALVMTWVGQTF